MSSNTPVESSKHVTSCDIAVPLPAAPYSSVNWNVGICTNGPATPRRK